MKIQFKYTKQHITNSNGIAISDTISTCHNALVPHKGDYITLPFTFKDNGKESLRVFEVVARHFLFNTDLSPQDHVIIIVKDAGISKSLAPIIN